jgi:transposase
LSSVASSVLTKSARATIDALIAGERDPKVLAQLAQGRMRSKIDELTLALRGRFTDHHALLLGVHLDHIDQIDAHIATIDARVEARTGRSAGGLVSRSPLTMSRTASPPTTTRQD